MDYSEFLRRLGADPDDQDPEMIRARQSGEEFEQAASEAAAFELRLQRAVQVPAPEGLVEELLEIGKGVTPAPARPWPRLALAAGLLIAVGAAGITWNLNRGWESVDAYVMDHYRHDGDMLLHQTGEATPGQVEEMFARFDVTAARGLADVISVIKYCPTPDGKGVHMVLNTPGGLVTLIYMPDTSVEDHQNVEFDAVNALYVSLEKGSAIIIGDPGEVASLYPLVQRSIVPTTG